MPRRAISGCFPVRWNTYFLRDLGKRARIPKPFPLFLTRWIRSLNAPNNAQPTSLVTVFVDSALRSINKVTKRDQSMYLFLVANPVRKTPKTRLVFQVTEALQTQ